jgi:hypothetical protein
MLHIVTLFLPVSLSTCGNSWDEGMTTCIEDIDAGRKLSELECVNSNQIPWIDFKSCEDEVLVQSLQCTGTSSSAQILRSGCALYPLELNCGTVIVYLPGHDGTDLFVVICKYCMCTVLFVP